MGNFIAGEKDLIDSQARKSDKYLKFFRRNLGNFIAGNEALNDAPHSNHPGGLKQIFRTPV